MRAFLAIPVLPPALAKFQSRHEQLLAGIAAVRWAPADTPHLTLHFFGTVTAEDVERALALLRPVAASHAPMSLRLVGVGSFPDLRRPRVLWCGVDGDTAALGVLASACTVTLQSAGFAVDARPYRPHCTIGRPRQPWPAASLRAWQEAAREDWATPPFVGDHAILYESVAAATGVRHLPRATLPLR